MGSLSANSFGPLMRFMVGAEYAAPRLAAHLVKVVAKAALSPGSERPQRRHAARLLNQ
jgi:hypothetical protein